jgi:hypothetical protein
VIQKALRYDRRQRFLTCLKNTLPHNRNRADAVELVAFRRPIDNGSGKVHTRTNIKVSLLRHWQFEHTFQVGCFTVSRNLPTNFENYTV